MDNDKNFDFDTPTDGGDDEFGTDTTSRARNRTVMLTPEITGEVRARLAKDMRQGGGAEPGGQPPFGAPPETPGGGFSPASEFSRPGSSFGGGVPAGGDPLSAPPSQSFSSMGGAAPGGMQSQPSFGGAAQQHMSTGERVIWGKESPVVGFLVSYDRNPNGVVFEVRSGRLIVTSEAAAGGNYLVIDDATVSPMHAIMRVSEQGDIQVLDQLSEYGTKIRRFDSEDEEELSGDKSHIAHGDVIYFGERSFCVCLVERPEDLVSAADEDEEFDSE
jgi:hypothetical protein